jgi:hypothetical protein
MKLITIEEHVLDQAVAAASAPTAQARRRRSWAAR